MVVHTSLLVSHHYHRHLWEQLATDIEVDLEREEAPAAEGEQRSAFGDLLRTAISSMPGGQEGKIEPDTQVDSNQVNRKDVWARVQRDYAERL